MNKKHLFLIATLSITITLIITISVSIISASNASPFLIKDEAVREEILEQDVKNYQESVYNEAVENAPTENSSDSINDDEIMKQRDQAIISENYSIDLGNNAAEIVNQKLNTNYTYNNYSADNYTTINGLNKSDPQPDYDLIKSTVQLLKSDKLNADEQKILMEFLADNYLQVTSDDPLYYEIYDIFGVEPPVSNTNNN